MEVDTRFVKNEQYAHSEDNVWLHPHLQKKNRLTKEKMDRQNPWRCNKPEMAYNLLFLSSLLLLLTLWRWN